MDKYSIGIDLGGTKIEVALVSQQGILLDRLRIPTESTFGPEKVINKMIDLITQLCAKHADLHVSCIGVGVAGQVEKETGVVVYAPNLKWNNIDIKARLAEKFGLPVAVCNDVRAAAWGEWLSGSGVGCNDLICIFIGTGIGGAIICNGAMVDGYNNTAGEIGHIVAQIDGPVCQCGNKGCLEAIAGGWAIKRDAQQAVLDDPAAGKSLLDAVGGDATAITAATVVAAALKGDEMAGRIIDNIIAVVTAALTSIINTIGPEMIIMGGGITEAMPQLISRIESGAKMNSLHAAAKNVIVTPAKLGNNAGAIGAALFALRSHQKQ